MKPEKLFKDISWMDTERLKGFSDEAISVLETNENMPERRLIKIREGLEKNIEWAELHYRETQKKRVFVPSVKKEESSVQKAAIRLRANIQKLQSMFRRITLKL